MSESHSHDDEHDYRAYQEFVAVIRKVIDPGNH